MNSNAHHAARFLVAVSIFILGATAQAQVNGLDNPGFASDLSGWEIFQGRVGEWDSEDADGSGDSGSALLNNEGVSNGTVPLVLYQCIPVQAEVEYEFGADLKVLADQPSGTLALMFVQGFVSGDCSGGQSQIEEVSSNSVDAWESNTNTITTAAGVMSLRIGLGIFKQPGVSALAQARFDNVYLLVPDSSNVNPSMSASWYNPDESGHGIMIHLLNSTDAWMCWFTFDLSGNPAWICALGTISGDTITFEEAFQLEGGAFPPNFDPGLIVESPWGSITVQFTGCNAGNLTWTTENPAFQSGSMPLVRLTDLWGASCN